MISPPRAEAENTAGGSAGGSFQWAPGPCTLPNITICFIAQLSPSESHLPSTTPKGRRGNILDPFGSDNRNVSTWTLPLHDLPNPSAAANYLT